jgi:putative protease
MTKNRIELLAPSGNLEILKVAVDTGADSVYLGLKEYSARAGADNFTLDELEEGVDYAHARSAKVFLALNTLMSDSEFELFYPTIAEAVNIGVDGLIVQDLAVLREIEDNYSKLEVIAEEGSKAQKAEAKAKIKLLKNDMKELRSAEVKSQVDRNKILKKFDELAIRTRDNEQDSLSPKIKRD